MEWAARWFYINAASFSGLESGGWAYHKDKRTVSVSNAERFRARISRLEAVRDRLAGVQIECADFRVMVDRYGGVQDNLLYCDPPYIGSRGYRHNFTKADHLELAELLNACKAKVLVTHYDHPLIRKLYRGWEFEFVDVKKHSAHSPIGKRKNEAVECIITNYQVQPYLFDVMRFAGEDAYAEGQVPDNA